MSIPREMLFPGLSLRHLEMLAKNPQIGEHTRSKLEAEIEQRRKDQTEKPPRTRRLLKLESEVRREIVAWAYERGAVRVLDFEQGYRLSRCKNCGQELGRRHATTRVEKGLADLLILWPAGRRDWWLECKSESGKQTEEQQRFQRYVIAAGGVYLLARSVDECEAAYAELN